MAAVRCNRWRLGNQRRTASVIPAPVRVLGVQGVIALLSVMISPCCGRVPRFGEIVTHRCGVGSGRVGENPSGPSVDVVLIWIHESRMHPFRAAMTGVFVRCDAGPAVWGGAGTGRSLSRPLCWGVPPGRKERGKRDLSSDAPMILGPGSVR